MLVNPYSSLIATFANTVDPALTSACLSILLHGLSTLSHLAMLAYELFNALNVDENMAINHLLPPKAARRNATANLKYFWALISMVSFTFVMRRHLIRLAPASFTSFRLAKLDFR